MARISISLLTFALPVAFWACGSESPSNPGGPVTRGSGLIGPAGGTLLSDDGKAKLVVPPNALTEPKTLTVKPLALAADKGIPSSGYDFGPDGLTFAVWAELTIENDAITAEGLGIAKIHDDGTRSFHETTVDVARHQATAKIPGFSNYGVVQVPPEPPVVTAQQQANRSIIVHFDWPNRMPVWVKVEQAINDQPTADDAEYVEVSMIRDGDDYVAHPGAAAANYHFRARGFTVFDTSAPSRPIMISDPGSGPVTHGAWAPLGASMNRVPSRDATRPSLAVGPGDTIYSSWTETNESSGGVFVAEWSGSTWTQVGASLETTPNTTSSETSSIRFDGAGNPIVIWVEGGTLYARRKSATGWDLLGNHLLVGTPGAQYVLVHSLAIDNDGAPVVAFSQASTGNSMSQIYVRRFESGAWATIGAPLATIDPFGVGLPSLAIDANNHPVVAFLEQRNGQVQVIVSTFNGSAWNEVGTPPSSDVAQTASDAFVAIDGTGAPVVAYTQYDTSTSSNKITVKRFDGSGWQSLPSPNVAKSAYTPCLVLGRDGKLHIAFAEDGATYEISTIYVRSFDGTTWTTTGGEKVDEQTAYLRNPMLVTVGNGFVVSWEATSSDGSLTTARAASFGL